jgi:hypothetical protein
MQEAGVVVATDGSPLSWHAPPNRTGGSLPDSRSLWVVLWNRRDTVQGFAHTHPGAGWPSPSWTDITTFAAIEDGLGRRLMWWIASADKLVCVRWGGPAKHDYIVEPLYDNELQPLWLEELRRLSNYKE